MASTSIRRSGRFPNEPVLEHLDPGSLVTRVHHVGNDAVFFGPAVGKPPGNRFDAPAQEYRTLYCAHRLEGSFVETILRRATGRILRRAFVDERGWSELVPSRRLNLAKVYDEGLQVLAVDAGQIGVDDYTEARRFSLDVYRSFPHVDGLAYRSRYDNGEICYALYDRVASTDLQVATTSGFAAARPRVDALMQRYGAVFDLTPLP